MEVLTWLDDHNGAVIAVLTTVLVLTSILVIVDLLGQRNERSSAHVKAYPMLHDVAHMYLAGRVHNGGPADAREVEWVVTLTANNEQVGEVRRYAQPLMLSGQYRTMMLDPKDRTYTLNELADMGVVVRMEWSWYDARRRWLYWPAKQNDAGEWSAQDLRDGFYSGWVLSEVPIEVQLREAIGPIRKAAEQVPKIKDELAALRKAVERATQEEE